MKKKIVLITHKKLKTLEIIFSNINSNSKLNSQDEEEDFSWETYLKETDSESAPTSCFCQHIETPSNEFKAGHKLETYDPRNTTSTCIGTIIEVSGPRIRLRLDGTDDRNDFWLMCDSELIHPFQYSFKNGRKISPPLGFGNDLSKWPKFLEKLIQTAGENVFAPESFFKTPPPRPPRNEFKVGQKLEAVDPKNPHLICPATIKETASNRVLVSFDGWSQSSQFWCMFNSRDLFPCGWCKKSGHTLQYPGNLEEKPAPVVKPKPAPNASFKAAANANASAPKKSKASKTLNTSTSSLSSNKSDLNVTMDTDVSASPNKSQTQLASKTLKTISLNEKVSSSQEKKIKIEDNAGNVNSSKLDLSIVKSEAVEPSEQDASAISNGGDVNEIENSTSVGKYKSDGVGSSNNNSKLNSSKQTVQHGKYFSLSLSLKLSVLRLFFNLS